MNDVEFNQQQLEERQNIEHQAYILNVIQSYCETIHTLSEHKKELLLELAALNRHKSGTSKTYNHVPGIKFALNAPIDYVVNKELYTGGGIYLEPYWDPIVPVQEFKVNLPLYRNAIEKAPLPCREVLGQLIDVRKRALSISWK